MFNVFFFLWVGRGLDAKKGAKRDVFGEFKTLYLHFRQGLKNNNISEYQRNMY